jgi:hypothetical protein
MVRAVGAAAADVAVRPPAVGVDEADEVPAARAEAWAAVPAGRATRGTASRGNVTAGKVSAGIVAAAWLGAVKARSTVATLVARYGARSASSAAIAPKVRLRREPSWLKTGAPSAPAPAGANGPAQGVFRKWFKWL